MSADATLGVSFVAILAATGLVLLGLLAGRRRLTRRLRSLERPLHELRGALGALHLGVAALERSADARPELASWLETMRSPVERATVGVRDLEAVRRGAQIAESPLIPIDLTALVLEGAKAWARIAPFYCARLDVDWRAGRVRVHGERGRLKQALDNLVSNALEHGGGRVLVEGELQGDRVRVKISDGGPGVPPDRVRPPRALRHSARGQGLAIAEDAVKAHGGRLVVDLGRHGPALVIELPVEQRPQPRAQVRLRSRTRAAPAPAAAGRRAPNAA